MCWADACNNPCRCSIHHRARDQQWQSLGAPARAAGMRPEWGRGPEGLAVRVVREVLPARSGRQGNWLQPQPLGRPSLPPRQWPSLCMTNNAAEPMLSSIALSGATSGLRRIILGRRPLEQVSVNCSILLALSFQSPREGDGTARAMSRKSGIAHGLGGLASPKQGHYLAFICVYSCTFGQASVEPHINGTLA